MKKLLIGLVGIMSVISSILFVSATQSVIVSAIVGAINHAPVILSVTPASDPKLLGMNKIQNYTLYFRDDEKDAITYTITPVSGYTNPISGTVNPAAYDGANGAYINFTYLSPSAVPAPNPTTITVTFNDGSNLVNKDIRLYIY